MYFFAYRITITNVGDAPARLMSRHWIITDGSGRVEHVKGPGVVGEQPRLEPGAGFQYTSFCPLPTPVGTMEGSYQMVRDDGREFDAQIAPFTLAAPNALN
jgi:ApaG protein